MTARIAVAISGVLLAVSAVSAVIWWVVLLRHDVPADSRMWVFLIGLACIQIASWVVILRLLILVKGSSAWLVGVIVLGVISVSANVLSGVFSPVAGVFLGVIVLMGGTAGLVAARRLRKSCS